MTENLLPADAPAVPPSPPGEPAPSRATRAALRVVQIGAVAAILLVTTFKIFELDRFYIPKELVLHLTAAVAGLLSLGAARRFRFTRVDWLLLGFLLASVLSTVFAANHWLAMRSLALTVSGIVLFWVGRALREADLARPAVAGLALAVVLAAVTSLAQAYGLETEWFTINRSPGGTLGNRNSVGHVAAFGLPLLLLYALWSRGAARFMLGALGIALVAGALVLTRSRAAWLGIMAALAVFFLVVVAAPALRRRGAVLARMLLLIVLAGAGVALALVVPNSLRWASDDPYLETARGVVNYREGSGRGRLVQYQTSLALAVSHPLGVGPGNWAVEYPAVARRGDPSLSRSEGGMTSNPWPSSDLFAIISERGLLGVALLLLALAELARTSFVRLRRAETAEEALPAAVLPSVMAGLFVAGLFDAVLLLPWPALIFFTAAGALWTPEEEHDRPGFRLRATLLLLLSLLSAAAALRSAGQIAAMQIYTADDSREKLELAARLDPGNYRVQLRLAQRTRRNREERCRYAVAAHELFPAAHAAERLARRCPR